MFKYFKYSEFDSPDAPGSGELINDDFVLLLDKAREIAAIPFVINSGVRTESHNQKVGGVSDSSHIFGYAADIACKDSVVRWKILNALLEVGFNRVGIGNSFIHVDVDPKKSPNVIWTY